MKAITVKQPYAWAIAYGHKPVENRGRPVSYRGRLAIHAGVAWSERGESDPRVWQAWSQWRLTLPPMNLAKPNPTSDSLWTDAGAVIAVADLVDCHPAAGCCKPWGDDTYIRPNGETTSCHHLVLENVVRLPEPVPCKGALGLWTPPPLEVSA